MLPSLLLLPTAVTHSRSRSRGQHSASSRACLQSLLLLQPLPPGSTPQLQLQQQPPQMLDPGIAALHVAHIGADLIYATSYDKPKEYVDEILAEVGRLVMREVRTRASDGTPRYALEIARQRSHSAKHPLMVHGYLAASKVDQSSQRQAYRSQSAREKSPSAAAPQRLLYYRPPEGRRRPAQQHAAASGRLARVSAWDGGHGTAAAMHHSADIEAAGSYGRPNKTILLRTRSSESSVWDVQLERLPKNQCASTRHRHRARDSELKLKLMNHEFARSAESLHGFLVGAQYNRSRGFTDVVANVLAGRSPEKSESVSARSAVDTDATAAATADSSYSSSSHVEKNKGQAGARQPGGGAGADGKTKVRPVSAVAAANDQAPWTQLHADNPPLYARPYSSIAGGKQQPAAERPLSALHKAIVIRQLPSATVGSVQPSARRKASISPATHVQPTSAANLKTSRPSVVQHSISVSSPKTSTSMDALQIVSHRVVQHAHARIPSMALSQQGNEIRTTEEANATSKTRQMKKDVFTSADRPSGGQLGNTSDMSVDGLGIGVHNGDAERAHDSASSVDSRGPNLDSPHIDQAPRVVQSSGVDQQDRDIPVAVPQPAEELDTEDSPVLAAASGTPMSSRLSIHVDVAVLHEDHDYSHASENGEEL